MEKTLIAIKELQEEGVISNYALGGATALLFYAEPSLTFDIDVFVVLSGDQAPGTLVNLGPLYEVLRKKGYQAEKEHVMICGIPVQFIPAYNSLVEEAVRDSCERNYQDITTRVLSLEHLLAIMIDTNRPKDRERIQQLWGGVDCDKKRLKEILNRHGLGSKWENTIGRIE